MSYHIVIYPAVRHECNEPSFLILEYRNVSLLFLRKAYCERLRLVMTRNIGKVGLLFKAYYVDAVKRTTNGVAENHSAVSANHSAGSAIPEKNGDRGGLVITLSWSLLFRDPCWYTNKRWTIHFCCCYFSIVVYSVEDLNWFLCWSGSREPKQCGSESCADFAITKSLILREKYTLWWNR